jgi:hypothetical protein
MTQQDPQLPRKYDVFVAVPNGAPPMSLSHGRFVVRAHESVAEALADRYTTYSIFTYSYSAEEAERATNAAVSWWWNKHKPPYADPSDPHRIHVPTPYPITLYALPAESE